ncbi:hypothetical protein, partial [Acuticoccus sediminis]|uniref:hypothetical protein n=1 Tax=Acuticoccus sediminis TaxID=2184697 RepID=UPI001B3BE4F3
SFWRSWQACHPPRYAAFLKPPSPSFGHSSGVVAQHGIDDHQELAGNGDEDDPECFALALRIRSLMSMRLGTRREAVRAAM